MSDDAVTVESALPASAERAPSERSSDFYEVSLDMFEGPLDLLLHLVKKHELPILDIPISFITERYLAYLDRMQYLNVEVASEYLLMAATLAYLKSLELVPNDGQASEADEEQSEEDPRQELIRRLLEYQKYKEAGAALDQRPILGRNVYLRGQPDRPADLGPPPLGEVALYRLVQEFARVLARAPAATVHQVVVERVRLMDKMKELASRLEREPMFLFDQCFVGAKSRHELVVTFLALLEMTRLKVIRLEQAPESEAIMVSRTGALGDVLAEFVSSTSDEAQNEATGEDVYT